MPFDNLLVDLAQAEPKGAGLREIVDSLARTPLSQVVIFVAILTVVRMAISPILAKTLPHQRYGTYSLLRVVNEFIDAVVYAGVFVFMIIRPFAVQAFLIPSGSMWPTLYVNDFIVANKAIYRYSDPKPGDVVVFRPPVEATLGHPEQVDEQGQVKVDFIKRCAGTPGDVVELRKGILFRNGIEVPDPTKHYSRSEDGGQTYTDFSEAEKASLPKASFKFIKWKGEYIPLNYTDTEANASEQGLDGSYVVHPKFVLSADEQKVAMATPPAPIPNGFYFMMGDNRNNSFDGRGWGLVKRESIIGRGEFIWLPLNRIGRTPPVTAWRTPKAP